MKVISKIQMVNPITYTGFTKCTFMLPKVKSGPQDDTLVVQKVIHYVAAANGLKFSEIKLRCRKKVLIAPRRYCIYLLIKHTRLTLKQIGEILRLDYTMVIYHRQKCLDEMAKSGALRAKLKKYEIDLNLN